MLAAGVMLLLGSASGAYFEKHKREVLGDGITLTYGESWLEEVAKSMTRWEGIYLRSMEFVILRWRRTVTQTRPTRT